METDLQFSEDDDATPLVVCSQESASGSRKYMVAEAAKKILVSNIANRPVQIVTVCGLYRSGKSFLLNMLMGAKKGKEFQVGNTVNACTAGIWLRHSCIKGENDPVLLLLDCEGSGNTSSDREHDARVVALAVLLCTVFLFNSKGVVNEGAIQSLSVVTSLAQMVLKQHLEEDSGGVRSVQNPMLLWVLRDFALALEDSDGKEISAKQYLDQALSVDVAGPRRDDLREAREKLSELFKKRDCFPLVRPVDEEDQLQRLADLPRTALRPKFLGQIDDLRKKVFVECPIKKSPNGEFITGNRLVALLEAYVDSLNSGKVPAIGSTWQHVSNGECQQGLDDALRHFGVQTLSLSSNFPCTEEDLEEGLTKAEREARDIFDKRALGDDVIRKAHFSELAKAVEEKGARLRTQNEDTAVRANEGFLRGYWNSAVEAKLRPMAHAHNTEGGVSSSDCATARKVIEDGYESIKKSYATKAVGPASGRRAAWTWVEQRKQAALDELAVWEGREKGTVAAKEAAATAGEEERRRLMEEGAKMADDVRKEIEESKKRMRDRAEEQRAAENSAKVEEVKLTEDAEKDLVDDSKQPNAKAKGGNEKKKSCCVTM
eukprot:gnl/MRDRNA2_/MRDRNA2_101944_c0_seq1.p1 gnl/MRDRNA2_/MRDRNA2_101944_c0~~gnl/MRDRNA2_/MRDRNA2_101944_c0_seq1.p1  ORF type:complete len:602 (-),score=138.91 gnl/MRDRNA2_/MRDRNA2_101944_c0_seq1:26-1831(-)